jgi:hypothetical protein
MLIAQHESAESVTLMLSYRGNGLRVRLATWLDISRTVLRLAAPAVDVLVRLSLAKAFFAPGMLPSGLVGDFRTAWPTIIVQ